MPLLQLCPVANQLIAMLTSDDGHSYIKTCSLAPKPACKDLDCIDQSPVITGKANTRRLFNAPIHALLKRARMPRNLHIRTSSLNGQRAAI